MLELRGVSKRYGETRVLHPTDLTVGAGRTETLLGTTGSGKSTLLRIIAGLVGPDTGTVAIAGEHLNAGTLPALRKRMGYMIQEGGLFPHLSLRANISLMARHLRWPRERIRERIEHLGGLAHMSPDLLDRFPQQVSGGQRQRAALMRALFLDPDILLLDEPLGALDPLVRADLQAELRDIFRTLGKTVILVTHDLAEAGFFADEIALFHHGRIVQRGTPEELARNPAEPFVARFINSQNHGFGGPSCAGSD